MNPVGFDILSNIKQGPITRTCTSLCIKDLESVLAETDLPWLDIQNQELFSVGFYTLDSDKNNRSLITYELDDYDCTNTTAKVEFKQDGTVDIGIKRYKHDFKLLAPDVLYMLGYS